MFVIVELKDHESKSHKILKVVLEKKIDIEELKLQICSLFSIQPAYQELTDKDERRIDLLDGSLKKHSIESGEQLILRHTFLNNWIVFKSVFDKAQEALQAHRMNIVEEKVDEALVHFKPLVNSAFFGTYPLFYPVYETFKKDFVRFMDQEFKYIEMAARDYFSKFFDDNPEDPIVTIKCEKKEFVGIQGGLLCIVKRNGEQIGKYHVKEHIGLSNHRNADLREIFVYKLLELIKIGPKVHFLPNKHYSCFGLYIATEDGFRRGNGVSLTYELRAQRDLIRRIFFLKDVHSENYGVDGNGSLSIIDFQIENHTDCEKVKKYLNDYKQWKGNRELRMEIGKECFKLWDICTVLDQANGAIAKQKDFFKKLSISLKPSHDFNEYFCQVKNNVQTLIKFFE